MVICPCRVSYLAGEFIESLQRRQVELNITASDVLCIKIAGLCHDLGHGPFSHMFDGLFMSLVNENRNWKVRLRSLNLMHLSLSLPPSPSLSHSPIIA